MAPYRVWILALAILLAGCGVFGPRPVVPTRAPAPPPGIPTVPPTRAALLPVQPSPRPVPSNILARGLADRGPWLLIAGKSGVAAYNPDGSAKIIFTTGSLLDGRFDLQAGRMPGSDWLALRTVKTAETQAGKELILLHLPDGQMQSVAPLLTTDPSPAGTSPVHEAVSAPGALLWSPDGRYLAFVAALDGPTADVYLFDPQTSSIRRLNAGPQQAYPLAWTPDGSQVIYAEGSGCGGAGCQVDSVWIVPAEAGSPRRLYTAQGSHGETVLGFWGDRQVIVHGSDAVGKYNIRRVDLVTGEEFSLYIGHFSSAAFDPVTSTAAWTVPGDLILNDFFTNAAGLDMISSGVPRFQFFRQGDWRRVVWLAEAGWFALGSGQMEGTVLVRADGRTVSYPDENWWIHPPQSSPDGKQLAFFGDGGIMKETPGLRVYAASGRRIETLTTAPVESLAWTPDGKGLFFLSENQLLYKALGGKPSLIVDPNPDFAPTASIVWLPAIP